jgi:hypothetical protein
VNKKSVIFYCFFTLIVVDHRCLTPD